MNPNPVQNRLQTLRNHLSPNSGEKKQLLQSNLVDNNNNSILNGKKRDNLQGEVAIITGSGQGIGAACAELFANYGASIVVTDLDEKKSDAMAKKINDNGGKAISVPGDITHPDFPEKLIQKTIDAFGKINHIINNAGYTWDGTLHKMTDKQWEAMLLVHNTAPFRILRAAAPHLRDAAKKELETTGTAQNRSIVNISSTSGLHGNFGQANYSTAKMGIVGFTKTVAKEWGMFNIRCNAVAFGFINTRLTSEKSQGNDIVVNGQKVQLGIPQAGKRNFDAVPLKRAGNVEEAAGGVLLLCLPESAYITGHCLEVTGGAGI